METARQVVTYTAQESGNAESRWIRVEQERPDDETLTVAEAAEIVDSLFRIDACEQGMGGGGEEADEEDAPTEEEFDEAMAEMLRRSGVCKRAEYWVATVHVYRSHKSPGYELRSETAVVESIEPVRERHVETVEASGASIALAMPYDGELRGIPDGVRWTVRGSTVNFDRPVRGRLVLRYYTRYDRVTLHVPTMFAGMDDPVRRAAREYAPGDPYGVGGDDAAATPHARPELPTGDVIAFWGDLAASCELVPPEQDDSVDDWEIRRICNPDAPDDDEDDQPGECWKTVRHYSMCACSKKRVLEWDSQASAPCDGFSAGAYVGFEEHFSGFVVSQELCDDADEYLQDPAFYRDHCCTSPPDGKALPRCRRSHATYNGGAEIESGAAHWRNIYGDDVIMIPVVPKSGKCGEVVTEWHVPQRNCCEGVIPLEPSPHNPTEIWPGREYMISAVHGRPGAELTWTASGGIVFRETGGGTYRTPSRTVWIRAEENVCPEPTITVDDGCNPLQMTFNGPEVEGVKLSSNDVPVTRGQRFTLSASGGVPGYMWQASGGVKLLGWSPDGATAYLEAPEDEGWCMGEVTVSDQCGNDDTATIRNATGGWYKVSGNGDAWDHPPCPPYKLIAPGSGVTHPKCGTYIVARTYMGGESGGMEGFPPCRRGEWYVGGVNVIDQEIIVTNGQTWRESCESLSGDGITVSYGGGCCHIKDGRYYRTRWYTNIAWEVYEWRC